MVAGGGLLLMVVVGALVVVALLAAAGWIKLRPRTTNALFLACVASLVAGLLLVLSAAFF